MMILTHIVLMQDIVIIVVQCITPPNIILAHKQSVQSKSIVEVEGQVILVVYLQRRMVRNLRLVTGNKCPRYPGPLYNGSDSEVGFSGCYHCGAYYRFVKCPQANDKRARKLIF